MHEKNLLEHGRVIKDFDMAEQQQGRIAARHRKQLQYARNRQQYGTARKPPQAVGKRKASATPTTAAGPAKQGRAEVLLPSARIAGAAGAPVATELSWEGM